MELPLGKRGRATTRMNPTGLIEVEGQRFEAHAEVGYIDQDEPILIVGRQGPELVVRRAPIGQV